jgi:hypothetical protein
VRNWALSSAGQIACDAITLAICGRYVPGIEMDRRGFVIALVVMSGVWIAMGLWLDSVMKGNADDPVDCLGILFAMAVSIPMLVLYPALADWATPHFNITSFWAYVVLVTVLGLVSVTYIRVFFKNAGLRGK